MKFIEKGNFEKANVELKANKNNAVFTVFEKEDNLNKSGLLSDVVFTLKNNYAQKNSIVDASSNLLKNFKPSYNATILDKILNQGASLVATTNLDEFGLGGTGTYSNHGIILNPLNNNHMVGGSSSGCAATFTKNIGFSIGSDTGDSVRLPASNVGKVGFKPSYGAVSRFGLFPYASSLDNVAWFTHNVSDSIILSNVLFGKDEKDMTSTEVEKPTIEKSKPQTIAYLDCENFVQPYLWNKYKNLISKLEQQGIKVVKIEPNKELLTLIKIVYDVISFAEASSNLSNLNGVSFGQRIEGKNWEETFANTRSEGFGFMVQRRLALGSYFLEKDNQSETFLKAQKVRRLINDWFTSIHNQHDIFIYPASPGVAPLVKKDKNQKLNFMDYILTGANLVGNPSLTLKLGTEKEMPFNLTIDSKIYNDKKMLSCALFIEEILMQGEHDE